jgi:hypothetical protein
MTSDIAPRRWEIRPEFDAPGATEQTVATMNWALKLQANVEAAEAGLIGRESGSSATATMIVVAVSPGSAADLAVEAFRLAARDGDIPLGELREVVVCPADLDPRA